MAISVRHWYVLMFKQAFTKTKKDLSSLSIKRAYEGKGALEYFIPSMFMRVKQFGTGKYISRKMVVSYVFIRETEGGIRLLKSKMPQLQLITSSESKAYNTQYVKLDDFEMTMVKKIADVYDGQLPCYRSDEYKLDGCDYVKVVDGPFKGIEGRIVTYPGRDSGQVILPIGDLFQVSTGDILSQYIQIIEFGKGNRHPYHMFELHMPRVLEALTRQLTKGEISAEELATMLIFTGRLENLQPSTLNIESQYSGLMLMSYTAAGSEYQADKERWLNTCKELLPKVKAELQNGYQMAMMYASTGDPKIAEQLHKLIDTWLPFKPTQQKKLTIVKMLERFEAIYSQKQQTEFK